MSILQIANRTFDYQIQAAPFSHDVLLLQSSKFNSGFWRPVLEALRKKPNDRGRILTVEWSEGGHGVEENAADLEALATALGFKPLDVLACAEAVPVLEAWEKKHPSSIGKSLAIPAAHIKTEDLVREVSEFCGI